MTDTYVATILTLETTHCWHTQFHPIRLVFGLGKSENSEHASTKYYTEPRPLSEIQATAGNTEGQLATLEP